ncbi:tetratricopeptide repeat protein [Aestuariirhabdus sp. LZHN29]|uniref:tetratricopeptide repeat protein n=1 Tax=Aestuariirhabdus sp. LZHN29 TaxID=3417462 RepID=UPI003CF5B58D
MRPQLFKHLLLLGALVTAPAAALQLNNQQAHLQLKWERTHNFLQHWIKQKQGDLKARPVAGLLKGHTQRTERGRALLHPPSALFTLDQLNAEWLRRATEAYGAKRWPESRYALKQLNSPIKTEIKTQAALLGGLLLIREKQFSAAAQQMETELEGPQLNATLRYNLALARLLDDQAPAAKELLEELLDDESPAAVSYQGYARLLLARLYISAGKVDRAIGLAEDIPSQHQLYPLALATRADAELARDDKQAALKALLELANNKQLPMPAYQAGLQSMLNQLGAYNQAVAVGEQALPAMINAFSSRHQLAQELASKQFYQQLLERASDDPRSELLQQLSTETGVLVNEIERLNTLKQLMDSTLKMQGLYQSLFDKGPEHLTKRLYQYSELMPYPLYPVPAEARGSTPEMQFFEQRLSELVGAPEPWGRRYNLLNQLLIWKHGENPWLKNGQLDKNGADFELDQFLEERLIRIDSLSAEQVRASTKNMKRLTRQASTQPKKLTKLIDGLKPHLQRALQKEAASWIRDAEEQLLWMATSTLPSPWLFEDRPAQLHFQLQQGQLRQTTVAQPPMPDISQAYRALKLLSDSALNGDIRLLATRYRADLSLASAIRKDLFDGQDPAGLDGRFEEAISLYQQLLKADDPAVGLDEVLYQLAHAQDQLGQLEQSLTTLQTLASRYPTTPRRSEVLFRLGELQFAMGSYDRSIAYYQELVNNDNPFNERAQFKLGWAQFKEAQYANSLDNFFSLLKIYWPQPGEQEALIKDLRRVIALSFSNMNGVKSIDQYFITHGRGDYSEQIYIDLGDYYVQKSRYNDAADTFTRLLAHYPTSPRAPYYQSRVVQAYVDGGFPSQSWPARERYTELFGIYSDYWRNGDEERRSLIRTYLEPYLLDLAQRDHALAQQGDDPSLHKTTIARYDHFIAALPNSEHLANTWFMKAEALTEMGEHERAAAAYEQAAYEFPDYEQRQKAGYAALLSYQHLYRQSSAERRALWLQQEITQSLRFVEHYPDADADLKIRTKIAEDYRILGQHEQAVSAAQQLLQQQKPDREVALRLWKVVAHSSFDTASYQQAEVAYQNALKQAPTPEDQQQFHLRIAESIYKQAEARQREGDLAAAVEHYLRLGKVEPNSSIRPQAEFDAATLQMQLKRWPDALATLEAFDKRYPKHPLRETLLEKLVLCYENTENWDKAATALAAIYQREGKSELGQDALWRSAALQEKAGNPRQAAKTYQRFINAFPAPLERAMEARLQLADLARDHKVGSQRRHWLSEIITHQDKATTGTTDRTRYLASAASLELAHTELTQYNKLSLSLPLEKSLARKQKRMESSIHWLTKTIDYQMDDHATEATVLIGNLYSDFAAALMNSERPAELSDLQLEQYDILLEEQAIPFEDKAIALHQLNVDRIRDGVYTSWVAASLDRLRELMPSRFDKPEQVETYVEQIN